MDVSLAAELGEPRPSTFIRIIHHPHSSIDQDKIIPLVKSALGLSSETGIDISESPKWTGGAVPWLPFRTRQDFEYTSTAVRGIIPRKIIDEQLHGQHNGWSDNSKITLRNSADMLWTLVAAREGLGVPVSSIPFKIWYTLAYKLHSVSKRHSRRGV